jgi:hypothetical protein
MVAESAPDLVVAVERDRVLDPHLPDGPADVVDAALESELGGVYTEHHQPVAGVLRCPGAEIGKLA